MNGTVIKRGKTWSVVVEVGRDENGKRIREWHSGLRTKREADAKRIELLDRLAKKTHAPKSDQTVGAFLDEWLRAIRPTVRPSTWESYSRNLRLHVTPALGMLRLDAVDGGRLNALYADLLEGGRIEPANKKRRPRALVERALELREAGGTSEQIAGELVAEFGDVAPATRHAVAAMLRREAERGGRDAPERPGLSPRTVRYVHTILSRAFRDAERWRRIVRSPVSDADPPRASATKRTTMRTWTAEELGHFLELAGDERLFPAWLLLATTGMRRGEALGLRWEDVDLEEGRARVQQTVVVVAHKVELSSPKTDKGRRSMALDSVTVHALRVHRRRQAEERLAVGPGWVDHGLVFCRVDGGPLHPERFSREFDRRLARWELPRIRLHDLRHTWATLALEAGVHPKVVSERLGHSGIGITLDVYSHVTPALEREAAETVAGLVFRPGDDGRVARGLQATPEGGGEAL